MTIAVDSGRKAIKQTNKQNRDHSSLHNASHSLSLNIQFFGCKHNAPTIKQGDSDCDVVNFGTKFKLTVLRVIHFGLYPYVTI